MYRVCIFLFYFQDLPTPTDSPSPQMYNTEVFSEYDDDDRYVLSHDEYEETSNSHDDTEEESSSSSDSRNYYGTTYNNRPAVKDQRASNTKTERPDHKTTKI